eukprot:jgi/Bigna1/80503/fgenesh1_pg.71_\
MTRNNKNRSFPSPTRKPHRKGGQSLSPRSSYGQQSPGRPHKPKSQGTTTYGDGGIRKSPGKFRVQSSAKPFFPSKPRQQREEGGGGGGPRGGAYFSTHPRSSPNFTSPAKRWNDEKKAMEAVGDSSSSVETTLPTTDFQRQQFHYHSAAHSSSSGSGGTRVLSHYDRKAALSNQDESSKMLPPFQAMMINMGSMRQQQQQHIKMMVTTGRSATTTTTATATTATTMPPQHQQQKRVKRKVCEGTKVSKLTFHYDPPVQSCKLTPYFLVETKDGDLRPVEESDDMQYRWFRGNKSVCIICGERATIQCLSSIKVEMGSDQCCFCSSKCMKIGFDSRRKIFDSHPSILGNIEWKEDGYDNEDDAYHISDKLITTTGGGGVDGKEKGAAANLKKKKEWPLSALFSRNPPPWKDNWTLIHESRHYRPQKDDVGCRLRLDAGLGANPRESWSNILTSTVVKEPEAPKPRRMIRSTEHQTAIRPKPTCKVLNYNILADIYATGNEAARYDHERILLFVYYRSMYPYCPLWALEWEYRSQRILNEIIEYKATIVCLQEVQENHYKKFFLPKLTQYGYDGVFKRKTRESRTVDPDEVDGCAIFFERKRYALRERHDVEFNSIAEMEELGVRLPGGSQANICVANTHIYWDPEFRDVKLWQTMVLMQHLQSRFMQRQKLPLILCGDFNSEPNSAVYQFLSENMIASDNPIMKDARTQELFFNMAIEHQLPLQSAYSVVGEPPFTNYTGHYVGTLDYIWFSHDMLKPVAILELNDEEELKKHTALPSPLICAMCLVVGVSTYGHTDYADTSS